MFTQVTNGRRALWYPAARNAGDARTFILFLPGFPKYPSKSKFMDIFLGLGYDVLVPMYSGTFDSDGSFSIEESVEDANLWHTFLKKGTLFTSPEEKGGLQINEMIIFSSSFGSLVAGLAMKKHSFASVHKCYFVSPLWDMPTYKLENTQSNQASETARLMDFSYPHSYRFEDKKDFFKKLSGTLEMAGTNEKFLDGTKEFHIFSGEQDQITPLSMAEALANEHASSNLYKLDGGHSSKIDMDKLKEIITHLCSDRPE